MGKIIAFFYYKLSGDSVCDFPKWRNRQNNGETHSELFSYKLWKAEKFHSLCFEIGLPVGIKK